MRQGVGGAITSLCCALVASSLGASPASAQTTWSPGAVAAAVFPLGEPGQPDLGWRFEALLARRQTPRVVIDVEGGFLWFPENVSRFMFSRPGGGTVTEIHSQDMAGPVISLGAARPTTLGTMRLDVGARVGVGLLREHSTFTTDGSDFGPPYDVVDWEISPIWTVGSTLLLPHMSWPGGRPRLDARLSGITLAGDGFIPVVSFGVGWGGGEG